MIEGECGVVFGELKKCNAVLIDNREAYGDNVNCVDGIGVGEICEDSLDRDVGNWMWISAMMYVLSKHLRI